MLGAYHGNVTIASVLFHISPVKAIMDPDGSPALAA